MTKSFACCDGFIQMQDFERPLLMYHGIRADSLSREPETVEWMRGINGGVLWDIGANVGAYSLIAASLHQNLQVVAIEPMYQNFGPLIENVRENSLSKRVRPVQIALSNRTGFGSFYQSSEMPGSALSALDGKSPYANEVRTIYDMPCFRLDDLVDQHGFPPPDHLKLDVDSTEELILAGCGRYLQDLQSGMVETDHDDQRDKVVAQMNDAGLGLVADVKHPLARNLFFQRFSNC